jgi:hypothetical protein
VQLSNPNGEVVLMSPSQALALGQALMAEARTLSESSNRPCRPTDNHGERDGR